MKTKRTGSGPQNGPRVLQIPNQNKCQIKKVLQERKRHTARRVASARSAALSPGWGGGGGYPHLCLMAGGT